MRSVKILLLSVVLVYSGICATRLYSQNQRAEGYMGIWFNTGKKTDYGYKLSGGFATFGSRHLPTAIYSQEAGKTFFVYGGTASPEESHLQIMISCYDHKTGKVPRPVIVYDKGGVRNPYDNASLSIDNGGYIWVFIGGWLRTRPGLVFKSTLPFTIDNFEQVLVKEMSFPQPWWFPGKGFVLLFSKTRNGLELNFAESADGHKWSGDRAIVSTGGSGFVSATHGNRIYVAFNHHPGGNSDRRTNLYLIRSDDFGKTWSNFDGKVIDTPIKDVQNEALVRDYLSENKLTYIYDLNIDRHGNPVILACVGGSVTPGPSSLPREWIVVTRVNGAWSFNKVCEPDNNFDAGALIVENKSLIIAGPSEPGPQRYGVGGDLAVWSGNETGETWIKRNDLTSGSKFNNSYTRRPFKAHKGFYAWWADGDAYNFSESRIYFTDKRLKRVWVLPYRMTRDYEKPVRIK